MIKHKVCMVGDFAVGKTSLTQRFVNDSFSDKYLTTIGVKIDSTMIDERKLIVWDVAGRDSLSPINASYLVGAAGIVLVGDGTRPATVDALPGLWDTVIDRIGEVPVVVAINKCDSPDWQADLMEHAEIHRRGWPVFATSAKQGERVTDIFSELLNRIDESAR